LLLPQAFRPRRRGAGDGDPGAEPGPQMGGLGAAPLAARARPGVRRRAGGGMERGMEIGAMRSAARTTVLGLLALAALLGSAPPARSAPVRAAYFYDYMSVDHLDSLARAGFGRALIHWITDSLGTRGAAELAAWSNRGAT